MKVYSKISKVLLDLKASESVSYTKGTNRAESLLNIIQNDYMPENTGQDFDIQLHGYKEPEQCFNIIFDFHCQDLDGLHEGYLKLNAVVSSCMINGIHVKIQWLIKDFNNNRSKARKYKLLYDNAIREAFYVALASEYKKLI